MPPDLGSRKGDSGPEHENQSTVAIGFGWFGTFIASYESVIAQQVSQMVTVSSAHAERVAVGQGHHAIPVGT